MTFGSTFSWGSVCGCLDLEDAVLAPLPAHQGEHVPLLYLDSDPLYHVRDDEVSSGSSIHHGEVQHLGQEEALVGEVGCEA